MDKAIYTGRDVVESLAKRFPQLYVAPAPDALEAHRKASSRGLPPQEMTLDHFIGSEQDELRVVSTPAGPVEVVFLKERADFECFLQIIGHKAQPDPIARTVGAITYRGLADWGKVNDAYREYVDAGGNDWAAEFSRLAKLPDAFRTEIIVISEGPYSDVAAGETPYGEDEWIDVSREIRLHHECAHVVCRRLMPDCIAAVWDEVTADVTGLICATGGYDVQLAARFLGVRPQGFAGGRLTEYLDEGQQARVDEVSREVYEALERIGRTVRDQAPHDAFDFLLELKRAPYIEY